MSALPVADPAAMQAWCRAFLAQMVACGIGHVAVSPGSRSTPMTVAADRTEGLELSMHLDERSGGFFALGLARASRRPVALLCTSGTAAANYLPAVVEAFHSGVPLLVLTTDRPPELQGIGAPQAIDQVDLYGTHTRWAATEAVAGTRPAGEAASLAHQAVVRATRPAPGPVHVNIGFREPLEPPVQDPPPVGLLPMPPDHAAVEPGPLPGLLGTERGLLVAGPMDPDDRGVAAVAELSRRTGWPVLADPASGLRRGPQTADAHSRSTGRPAASLATRSSIPTSRQSTAWKMLRASSGGSARRTRPRNVASKDVAKADASWAEEDVEASESTHSRSRGGGAIRRPISVRETPS